MDGENCLHISLVCSICDTSKPKYNLKEIIFKGKNILHVALLKVDEEQAWSVRIKIFFFVTV